MKYYTYITTNLINGRQYVGDHSTDNILDGYMGSGVDLKKDIKKYGKTFFKKDILEFFNTKVEAFKAQKIYIKLYETHLDLGGYNKNWTGGQWPTSHSEKTKNKISKGVLQAYKENPDILIKISEKSKVNSLGKNNGMYGKKQNIQKMKDRWLNSPHPWIGKNHTEKSKNQISESHLGKIVSADTKEKISKSTEGSNNPMYNKKHNDLSKEKQRISALNRKKIKCQYCEKISGPGMHKRWHGKNCKNNI